MYAVPFHALYPAGVLYLATILEYCYIAILALSPKDTTKLVRNSQGANVRIGGELSGER